MMKSQKNIPVIKQQYMDPRFEEVLDVKVDDANRTNPHL